MTTIKEAQAQEFIREMESITAESEYLEGKEQDAYAQGFKDAVAMAYIQLTGTANGKGFIDTLIEQTIKEERKAMFLRVQDVANKEAFHSEEAGIVVPLRSVLTALNQDK